MHHGKRHRLSTADIDHALRAQNIEVFFVCSYTTIPFRIISFCLSSYLTCCNFFQNRNVLIYENFINFDCLVFYKVKSNMNFKKNQLILISGSGQVLNFVIKRNMYTKEINGSLHNVYWSLDCLCSLYMVSKLEIAFPSDLLVVEEGSCIS